MFTYTHHTLLLCMMVKIKIFCIHVVESNSFDTHHIEATDSFNETLKWGSKCLQIHFSRKIQNLLSLWMVVSCDSILSLIRAQNVYKMNGEGWCHSMEIPLLRAKNLLKTFRPNRLFNENSLPVTIWKHSILHQLSAFSLHFVHYVILVPLSMSFYLFFISLICIFQLCFCCRRRCCCWLFFVLAVVVAVVASFFNSLMVHWIIELTVRSFQYTKVSDIRFHLVDCWNEKKRPCKLCKNLLPLEAQMYWFFFSLV